MTIGQYIDDSHSLSFIHSGHFYIAPSKSSTTQRRSRLQHGYCIGVLRRSAQATAGKGLAQGPYMAARAGGEPTTLRLKAIDSTKTPPCPELLLFISSVALIMYMRQPHTALTCTNSPMVAGKTRGCEGPTGETRVTAAGISCG